MHTNSSPTATTFRPTGERPARSRQRRQHKRFTERALDDTALVQDIARFLHLWPAEVDLSDAAGCTRTLAALECALRSQRRHAVAGHWTYDIAIHARLLQLRHAVAARQSENRKNARP